MGGDSMGILLSGTESDQPADASELPVKRALMFLAEGFEDAEAVCAIDVLGWTHYRPSVATIELDVTGFHERVRGAFGITLPTSVAFADIDCGRYDALIVPGGFHNRGFDEAYDDRLRDLARSFHASGRLIATMCVGVLPIAEAGLLERGTATTYALSSRHDNLERLRELGCTPSDEPVIESNGIISCSGPAHAEAVLMQLIARLAGPEAAAEVARYRDGRH